MNKKKNYGHLNNVIHTLYDMRYGKDAVAVQKALSLAFDISYNRPVQDTALKDLADACHNLAPDTMEAIKALKEDAVKNYPSLVNRIQMILVFS